MGIDFGGWGKQLFGGMGQAPFWEGGNHSPGGTLAIE